MTERERFEAWARTRGMDLEHRVLPWEEYDSEATNAAWDAWQAALSPEAEALAEAVRAMVLASEDSYFADNPELQYAAESARTALSHYDAAKGKPHA